MNLHVAAVFAKRSEAKRVENLLKWQAIAARLLALQKIGILGPGGSAAEKVYALVELKISMQCRL